MNAASICSLHFSFICYFRYWGVEGTVVTAWLAVDDADIGNGCMKVIPGTFSNLFISHLKMLLSVSVFACLPPALIIGESKGQKFGPPPFCWKCVLKWAKLG